MPNIDASRWNYDTAAYLLLRAGFGHDGKYSKRYGEATLARKLAQMAPEEAVDFLLNIPIPTPTPEGPGTLERRALLPQLQAWWLERMLDSRTAVLEKIVLFLHTHFATAYSRVNKTLYLARQNALFRRYALGDFRELVKEVNIDPAMLWWLDGQYNTRTAPNENYARELMELFTLGVYDFVGQKNYSQTDVKEAARMLSGWRFREDAVTKSIESYFTMSRHDRNQKIVFARDPDETPLQNPANRYEEPANSSNEAVATDEHRRLIDAIFRHVDTEGRPTAARFLARKAWKFYAYDPEVDAGTSRSDLPVIDDLADVFHNSGYNLKALLRALFLREEFYQGRGRTVKSPTEYVVGSLRMLKVRKNRAGLYTTNDSLYTLANDGYEGRGGMGQMGQILFDPPDVFSWKGNEFWITSHAWLNRLEFAKRLAYFSPRSAAPIRPKSFLSARDTTRAQVVDRLLKLLGPVTVDPDTRNALIAWLGPSDPIRPLERTFVETRVTPLIQMILSLPQYHVH